MRVEETLQAVRRERDELRRRLKTMEQEQEAAGRERERGQQEQARLLEALFTHILDPVAILDREFNFVRVNRAYAEAGARRVEDFPGHNHFEFYPSEYRAIFEEVVATKSPYTALGKPFSYAEQPERGVTYWDWSLVPLLDEQGEVEYLVLSLREVTERKRVEAELRQHRDQLEALVAQRTEELRASEERYRAVADFTSDWELWVNPEGGMEWTSPSVEAVTGYTAEEFYADPELYHRLVHPEDLPELVRHEREQSATADPAALEFRIVRREGTVRWMEHVCRPVYDAQGRFRGRRGTNRDITDRKQMEAERERLLAQVETERRRLFAVLNMMPGYVCLLTPDYGFRFVNQRFLDLFGDPEGRRCYEHLFHRQEPCEGCQSFDCLQTGAPQVWGWPSPQGSVFEVYDYRFVDADGSPLVLEFGLDISARKQAEAERERLLEELTAEQALLEAIVDQAPVGILAAEAPSGRLLLVNKRMREIWRAPEFQAESVHEFNARYPRFQADGQPVSTEQLPLWRALSRGEVVTDEEQGLLRADGTRGNLSANAAPVRDAEGNIQAAVLVLTDVTYQRWADEELHRYQEHLEELVAERTAELERATSELKAERDFIDSVLNTVGALVIVLDAEGRIVRFNRACEEVTGYSAEEVRGRPFWDFLLLPEEVEQVRGVFRELLNNLANRYENYWVTKSGERRFISFTNTALLGSDGLVEYVIASGLDITEKQRLEQALRESEEKYRSLVEEANVVVLSTDTEGKITFLNPYAQRFFGYAPEEILGRHIVGTIVPEAETEAGDLARMVAEVAAHPEEYGYSEQENVTREGRRVWMAWSNQPLHDAQGQVVGLLAIGVDRTAQREAEEMLRDYRERLRSLASELALAEERERRRVAVGIHDHISQTLALCKMRLGRLRRSSLGLAWEEPLSEVEELVDQVIDHTRTLTFELSPPVLYELGLCPALEWVCEHTTERQGLPCYFEGGPERLPLAEDVRAVLFQGAREALTNVVKHAHANQARVRVWRDESYAYVAIEDDGVGFDVASLGQGGSSMTFGLFNLQERLHYLGGEARIESTPGRGTRVLLRAPLSVE